MRSDNKSALKYSTTPRLGLIALKMNYVVAMSKRLMMQCAPLAINIVYEYLVLGIFARFL